MILRFSSLSSLFLGFLFFGVFLGHFLSNGDAVLVQELVLCTVPVHRQQKVDNSSMSYRAQSISPSSTSFTGFENTGGSGSSSSQSGFMNKPSCSNGLLPPNLKLPNRSSELLSGLVSSAELGNCSPGTVLSISKSSRNREFSFISTVFSICSTPESIKLKRLISSHTQYGNEQRWEV